MHKMLYVNKIIVIIIYKNGMTKKVKKKGNELTITYLLQTISPEYKYMWNYTPNYDTINY